MNCFYAPITIRIKRIENSSCEFFIRYPVLCHNLDKLLFGDHVISSFLHSERLERQVHLILRDWFVLNGCIERVGSYETGGRRNRARTIISFLPILNLVLLDTEIVSHDLHLSQPA